MPEGNPTPMTDVLGIDPSLTGTGIAVVGPSRCYTATVKTSGTRTDTLTARDGRLARIADRVADFTTSTIGLAVIEGPAMASHTGNLLDRYGLWWRIVHRLHQRDIPVAVCPPTTLKKWATGKGNADKIAVALGIARLWPAASPADDNQADALGLATMGAQFHGLALPCGQPLARHLDSLSGVAWPHHVDYPACG